MTQVMERLLLSSNKWLEIFITSENYRDLLTQAIDAMAQVDPLFSQALLAKRAGLKSKSLITDIKTGRRRITPKNFYLLQKGLLIPLEMENAFRFLVAKEEPDIEPHLGPDTISKEYDRVIQSLKNKQAQNSKKEQIYHSMLWPVVFSALGDEKGATLEDISSRTHLSKLEIRQVLAQFKYHQLIRQEDDRYIVLQQGIDNYQSSYNDCFKAYFIHSMKKAVVEAEKNFTNQLSLFANATFSIKESHVPTLRRKMNKFLQDTLMADVDDCGDRVGTLNISFCLEQDSSIY